MGELNFCRLGRKLVTRPIWWWERRRQYVAPRYLRFFPVIANRADSGVALAVLTTPPKIIEAALTAWSWLRVAKSRLRPIIVVDGTPRDAEIEHVRGLLPGVKIVQVGEVLADLPPQLERIGRLLISRPTWSTGLLKKVALLHVLSFRSALLYSDNDILAFNRPRELLESLSDGRIPRFNAQSADSGVFDPYMLKRSRSLGIDPYPGFNSGLLYLPPGALDMELTRQLVEGLPDEEDGYFVEQTILGSLMAAAEATPLPLERYVVNLQRQFVFERDVDYEGIAMRHFIYPVRHLLYRRGIPQLRKLAALERSPEETN